MKYLQEHISRALDITITGFKSVNIDTLMDLKMAEILIKENKCNNDPQKLLDS